MARSTETVGKGVREKVLPKVDTYEQALNQALEIIGEVDVHSGTPHLGKQGVSIDKIVGRDWHGNKVTIRLDHDPVKGPHLNVTDYRLGKGVQGKSIVIPFEGTIDTVRSLLKSLNTKASLETAKSVFEHTRNQTNLDVILNALKKFNL